MYYIYLDHGLNHQKNIKFLFCIYYISLNCSLAEEFLFKLCAYVVMYERSTRLRKNTSSFLDKDSLKLDNLLCKLLELKLLQNGR